MSAVGDILLAPDVRPFAVAAAIMLALGGIEALIMLVGFSLGQLVGQEAAVEADSHHGLEVHGEPVAPAVRADRPVERRVGHLPEARADHVAQPAEHRAHVRARSTFLQWPAVHVRC